MPNITSQTLHAAYVEMALERLERGFTPFMLTLMFNPLPGTACAVQEAMMAEATWLYGQLLTRLHRRPHDLPIADLPLWLVFPDRPVPKAEKQSIKDVSINDGMHLHAAVVIPPGTRLADPLNLYIAQHQDRFVGPGRALARIDARQIYHTPDFAFSYVAKALERGWADSDDVLVLPKAHSEMGRLTRR